MLKVKRGYTYILALILLVLSVVITACEDKSKNTEINNIEEVVMTSERDNIKEINYLLYNESAGEKPITLSFPENYTKQNFSRIELLQDDHVVSNHTLLRDTTINDHGQFVFTLTEYVSKFNRVRFFDEKGDIIFALKVGQYILEKINIPTDIPEKDR